jgi:hypothetical protein
VIAIGARVAPRAGANSEIALTEQARYRSGTWSDPQLNVFTSLGAHDVLWVAEPGKHSGEHDHRRRDEYNYNRKVYTGYDEDSEPALHPSYEFLREV